MRFVTLASISAALFCGSNAWAQAQPADPTTAAIFAGGNVTFNSFGTVAGGAVVANGNIVHNGGTLNVPSMYAGGTFTAAGASFQNTQGDILFGGDISTLGGPGSVLGGNVTSGGSISLLNSSETISGNVTAAGGVSQPFSFATINGNVLAGGSVNIQGTVGGGVTFGGTYTQGVFAHVGGLVVQGGPVTPTPYVPLALPAGRNLTPGNTNISLADFQNISITPGTYGALTFASGNTVSLTAGQYVFSGISNGFSLNHLSFDTSGGPINVYVAGDLNFNMVQVVNGEPLFTGGHPNPLDSGSIFLEVGGSYTGASSTYGTIFAPNGNITLNSFAQVTGRLLAGHDVTLNTGGVTVVPEPASLTLMALSGASLLLRRRKPLKAA